MWHDMMMNINSKKDQQSFGFKSFSLRDVRILFKTNLSFTLQSLIHYSIIRRQTKIKKLIETANHKKKKKMIKEL